MIERSDSRFVISTNTRQAFRRVFAEQRASLNLAVAATTRARDHAQVTQDWVFVLDERTANSRLLVRKRASQIVDRRRRDAGDS
jgi:hypothetical protein